MEHDDILEDLLSWTGDTHTKTGSSKSSDVSSGATHKQPSLHEGCVNTSSTDVATTKVGLSNTVGPASSSLSGKSATSNKKSVETGSIVSADVCTSTAETTSKAAFELPKDVSARLMPHQRDGVRWLYTRHCKSRACLLADEMGLGKTVQVAAFLGELYRRKCIKTSILIVPPTLVPMWEAALGEWGGAEVRKLVEVIHNDARKKRQARWRKLKYGLPCILLTTYGVLRQDATDMSAALVDYVVLDEAHLIKDANTHAFKSALTLSARHKICLSGTPLMNSFDDMWSLFRFLDGSILTLSKSDFNAVSTTLLRGNERDATAGQRDAAAAELAKLQAAIRPFMLRREKKDLADAVASVKRDVVVWVRLSPVQQQQYEAFLELKASTSDPPDMNPDGGYALEEVEEGGDYGSAASSGANTNPLLLLTMLSQICNHPWLNLVDNAFTAAVAHPYTAPLPEMGDIFAGSKLWVALQLLIRSIRAGHKCLVFSRSKRLLRLLRVLLQDWGVPHVQVDGDTASEQRFAAVQEFNENERVWVCLLTTQVGGVGLTFTAASAVVLLDPSWNPSADAQAVDRVHRIGQSKDVTVYRLVTCGTVEEKVYRNQIFKRMAALQSMRATGSPAEDEDAPHTAAEADSCTTDDVESTSSELYRYFTRVQLRSMFVMDEVDRSSTAEQLELLHPGHVDDGLRRGVCSIHGVCDVSDNSCVLTEKVDARAVAAEQQARSNDAATSCEDADVQALAADTRTGQSEERRCRTRRERAEGVSVSPPPQRPRLESAEKQHATPADRSSRSVAVMEDETCVDTSSHGDVARQATSTGTAVHNSSTQLVASVEVDAMASRMTPPFAEHVPQTTAVVDAVAQSGSLSVSSPPLCSPLKTHLPTRLTDTESSLLEISPTLGVGSADADASLVECETLPCRRHVEAKLAGNGFRSSSSWRDATDSNASGNASTLSAVASAVLHFSSSESHHEVQQTKESSHEEPSWQPWRREPHCADESPASAPPALFPQQNHNEEVMSFDDANSVGSAEFASCRSSM